METSLLTSPHVILRQRNAKMINFHLFSESVLMEQRLSPTKEYFLLVIPSYLVAEDLGNTDWSTLTSQGSCT